MNGENEFELPIIDYASNLVSEEISKTTAEQLIKKIQKLNNDTNWDEMPLSEMDKVTDEMKKISEVLGNKLWLISIPVLEQLQKDFCKRLDKKFTELEKKIDTTEARLRNHRHESTKNFTGKAEY